MHPSVNLGRLETIPDTLTPGTRSLVGGHRERLLTRQLIRLHSSRGSSLRFLVCQSNTLKMGQVCHDTGCSTVPLVGDFEGALSKEAARPKVDFL